MANEATRIVSLTITEGGYNFSATTGEFDGTVALLDAAVGEAPDVEVPSDEPAPASARSFHVASTGVVDVVHDPDDPDTADAATHPEAHADADEENRA